MIKKTLDASILLGIYETAMLLVKKNIVFVAKQGLTNQQWILLIHLAKDPNLPYLIRQMHTEPMMASELADSLGVSRANITNLLTTLIEKDLISQIEDKKDRRKKRLVLTPKGETLIKSMQAERNSSNSEMFKGYTTEQKEEFLGLVQKLTENIQNL